MVEMMVNAGVEFLPIPPTSCNLNNVERVWSVLKIHWIKELMKRHGQVTIDELPVILKVIIEEKVNPTVQNIVNGGFERFQKVLNGQYV